MSPNAIYNVLWGGRRIKPVETAGAAAFRRWLMIQKVIGAQMKEFVILTG